MTTTYFVLDNDVTVIFRPAGIEIVSTEHEEAEIIAISREALSKAFIQKLADYAEQR